MAVATGPGCHVFPNGRFDLRPTSGGLVGWRDSPLSFGDQQADSLAVAAIESLFSTTRCSRRQAYCVGGTGR